MSDDPVLEARYSTWSALKRDVEQQLGRGGLLLRFNDLVAERSTPLVLRVLLPSGEVVELTGTVLQVLPGHGVAMQLDGGASETVADLTRALAAERADGPAPPDDPVFSRAMRRPGRLTLPTDPVALRRALEEMTVNEKRQAALAGGREARLLLIRDTNKAVHLFVFKNPRITLEEVEAFAKMPSVNPDALRMVAVNRDWTKSFAVCRNLVRNPKTPLREALALLERLPIAELRAITKSNSVRAPIQQAARKKVGD